MTKEELQKLLRYLKSKGIRKGEVAVKLVVTAGYLSKLGSPEKPITPSMEKNIRSLYSAELKEMNTKVQKVQKVPRETEKHGTHVSGVANFNAPLPLGNLVVTLGDYVDLLKKQAEIYQKMAETNLGTILKNQEIGGGIVQELLERDVLRDAKGNPKKAEEILEAIRLKIAKTSGIALTKYIHDGEGIAHK